MKYMDNLSEKVASVAVKYTDLDNNLAELSTSENLTGNIGDKINYSTADEIKNLTNQGYVLVNDPFDSKGKEPVFSEDQDSYMVTFKHGREQVTVDNLKYGCKLEDLQVKGTQTVHYVGAGDKTPADNVQTSQWSRTVTIDAVTHELVTGGEYDTDWAIVPGQKTEYDQVATPVIDGFHADRATVPATAVTQDDIETTVTYAPNGKIIPVDPSGKPIPNVPTPQYPTNPTDPTAVTPDEPVPDIPGWVPSQPTVTPTDPGKDTPVTYNQIQKADLTIVDQDNNNQQIIVAGITTKFNADGIENTKTKLHDLCCQYGIENSHPAGCP